MHYLQQYIVEEYIEEYNEGRLSRRDLVKLVTAIAGSAAAASILDAVPVRAEPEPAPSKQATGPGITVSPDDPDITAYPVRVPARDGAQLIGYLSMPKGQGPFPGVLVIHENQGLLEHFRDVTRRFAKAGYASIVIDLLSRQGGAESIAAAIERSSLIGQLPPDQMLSDELQALEYLKNLPRMRPDRIGATGYCFGGGMCWRVAIAAPDLKAAIPYYGAVPPAQDVPRIQAAVLAFYAANDPRINAGIPGIEEAMRRNNKIFEYRIFPNSFHGFFNDTRGETMNLQAARESWEMSLAWFGRYLRS